MPLELVKYQPMAIVTFKDGSSPVFIPLEQKDPIGEAVNTGKTPLVHIGSRWVDRYTVKGIIDLSEYDASTAKGWLPLCPSKYRADLALHIDKNEESSGKTQTAYWAQCTVEAWIKKDSEK